MITNADRQARKAGTSSIFVAVGAALFAISLTACIGQWFSASLFFCVCGLIAVASLVHLRISRMEGRSWGGLASLIVAVLSAVAVGVPGYQLLVGARESRLATLGVFGLNASADVTNAFAVTAVAVCAFYVGEHFQALSAVKPLNAKTAILESATSLPGFYAALLVGIVFTFVQPGQSQEALELRGEAQGQGLIVALAQCLPAAMAIGILKRHWDSRLALLSSVAGMGILLSATQSRSPVLLIVVAGLVRMLVSKKRLQRIGRLVVGFSVAVYLTLVFIVGFSVYRTQLTEQGAASFSSAMLEAGADPVGKAATVGALDTADGLVLSMRVERSVVGASVFEPLYGVVNLVPLQIWQAKPEFLGPRVTHAYTRFGGRAGMFLSGPGYFYIIWFGLGGVVVGFLALGLIAGTVGRRSQDAGLLFCLWIYFLCRFIIGGDAFDLLYVLTIVVGLIIANVPIVAYRTVAVERRNHKAHEVSVTE